MPIYRLDRRPLFPPPEHAEPDGLLAVGGDLSVDRLLEAYRQGIFPWFEPGEELLWWCPDPRMILEPASIKVSRSLRSTLKKGVFETRFDTAFDRVIHACAAIKRKHEDGTWISREIERSYGELHKLGYAHSIESWADGELVGGLYGVCLGGTFFGESMFAHRADASKVALVALAEECVRRQIAMIDCQITSPHLISMGAREIPREDFLQHLRSSSGSNHSHGSWGKPTDTQPAT